MPPVGFEPTMSAGERPQTYALERAATGTGFILQLFLYYSYCFILVSLLRCCPVIVVVKVFEVSDQLSGWYVETSS